MFDKKYISFSQKRAEDDVDGITKFLIKAAYITNKQSYNWWFKLNTSSLLGGKQWKWIEKNDAISECKKVDKS